MAEAYELFGCNNADIFVMSISGEANDSDATIIQYDIDNNIPFPSISGLAGEGNGSEIAGQYGVPAFPTYIVIAPDHSIAIQDIWPVPGVDTFINAFESLGIEQSDCDVALTAGFSATETSVCTPASVTFENSSNGNVTGYSWSFEGGNPATSTDENPVVSYETPGVYNVSLEVTDGTETNTLDMDDYITVNEGVGDVLLTAFNDVCVNWASFDLTGGYPVGGVYSGEGVTDGMFDPATAGAGTHTITYTYTNAGGCFNSFSQDIYVDACVGIDNPGDKSVRIFPNPTTGNVGMELYLQGDVLVQVYNVVGTLVFEANENAEGFTQLDYNLSHLQSGMYFIVTTAGTEVTKTKLNIID